MIESKKFLIAKCDKCKEYYGSEDVAFYVFSDMKELSEALESAGWDSKLGKITCAECKAKHPKKSLER